MSKVTPRSVPSTISASCDAVRPRKNGEEGMFSIPTMTPASSACFDILRTASFALATARSSNPGTAIDDSPGWTVTTLASSSAAASRTSNVSCRDASLSLSLIAAMFQSQIGAWIWHSRPYLERTSKISPIWCGTDWSASEKISQSPKCSDTGPAQRSAGRLLNPVQETPIIGALPPLRRRSRAPRDL